MVTQRENILRAAIQGVRMYGLGGVRIKHISSIAGSSVGNIYQHFGSKENLMRECFEWVDRQISRLYNTVTWNAQNLSVDTEEKLFSQWKLWYHWLLDHPDETIFYHQYINEPFYASYDKERDASAAKRHYQHIPTSMVRDGVNAKLFLFVSLNTTLMYARAVIEGAIPNTEEMERNIFMAKFYGMGSLLKMSESVKSSEPSHDEDIANEPEDEIQENAG
jgi:AcrR family transcriptional regulator